MNKLLIFVVLLTAGCATGIPTYQNEKTSHSTTLEAPFPNLLSTLGAKTAAIHFVEIDGIRVGKNAIGNVTRKVYVAPGLRKITLGFRSGSMELTSGQFIVELETSQSAHYLFTADVVGIDYDLSIWDISNGEAQKTLVKKTRTEIRTRHRLHTISTSSPQ